MAVDKKQNEAMLQMLEILSDNVEYSVRALRRARDISKEVNNLEPLFIPVDRIKPETTSEAINRIMLNSLGKGESIESAYETLRGEYDDIGDGDGFDVLDTMDDDSFVDIDGFEVNNELASMVDFNHVEVETTPTPTEQPKEESVVEGDGKAPSAKEGGEGL